jgi:DNA-binding CsgD family transcriptional regulator
MGGARARLRAEIFVGFDHLARVDPEGEAKRLRAVEPDLDGLALGDWFLLVESIVGCYVDAGRYEAAAELAESALERLRPARLAPRRYAGLALNLASAHVEVGRWDDVEGLLGSVEEVYPPARDESATIRLRLLSRRGPARDLPRHIATAIDHLDPAPDLVAAEHRLADVVEALYAAGQPDAARSRLVVLRGETRDWWFAAIWPAVNAAMRAEVRALHRSSDKGDAELVVRLAALSDRFGLAGPSADAYSAEQAALMARLRGNDTPRHWTAAVEGWATIGRCWDEAVCRLRLAEASVAHGDRVAAAEELAAAHAIARRLGAQPLEADIRATTGRWGISLPRMAHPGPPPAAHQLTAREREVLGLVADGLTNHEVARALAMSPKTASVHVSRILAKLQAGNRTEAVAIARRQGVLG